MPMTTLTTVRDAKTYLVNRIATQAEREGVSLSGIERKMLWFSETGETLPDMKAISNEFDRTCDQDAFEQKIAALVRNIRKAPQSVSDDDNWDQAVRILSKGDHYLVVLIDNVDEQSPDQATTRGDRIRMILAAAVFVALVLPVTFWLRDHIANSSIARVASAGAFIVLFAAVAWVFKPRL